MASMVKLSYPESVLLDLRHSVKVSVTCPELIVSQQQRNHMNAAARIRMRTHRSPPQCVNYCRGYPIETCSSIDTVRCSDPQQEDLTPGKAQRDTPFSTPSYIMSDMFPLPRGMWLLKCPTPCLAHCREQNFGCAPRAYGGRVPQWMMANVACMRLHQESTHHNAEYPSENRGPGMYLHKHGASNTHLLPEIRSGGQPMTAGNKEWPSTRSSSTGSSCDIEIRI